MLAWLGPDLDQSATTVVGMHAQRPGGGEVRARWKARSQTRSGAPGRTLPALRAAESQAPEKPLASLTRSFPIARCAIHLSRVSCGARAGSSVGHCPVPAPCSRAWPAWAPASMRGGTAQQHMRRSTAASGGVNYSTPAWSDALPERPARCIPACRLCVAPRPNCRMSAVRRKIVKERGAEPTELEESVAQVRARAKHGALFQCWPVVERGLGWTGVSTGRLPTPARALGRRARARRACLQLQSTTVPACEPPWDLARLTRDSLPALGGVAGWPAGWPAAVRGRAWAAPSHPPMPHTCMRFPEACPAAHTHRPGNKLHSPWLPGCAWRSFPLVFDTRVPAGGAPAHTPSLTPFHSLPHPRRPCLTWRPPTPSSRASCATCTSPARRRSTCPPRARRC